MFENLFCHPNLIWGHRPKFYVLRFTLKKLAIAVFTLYIVAILSSTIMLMKKKQKAKNPRLRKIYNLPDLTDDDKNWNPWGEEFEDEITRNDSNYLGHKQNMKEWGKNKTMLAGKAASEDLYKNIEVWSTSEYGMYLWLHIFDGGKLENKVGGIWQYGFKRLGKAKIKFRTGSGVIPSKVPLMVDHLVLILSIRDSHEILLASVWLNFINHLQNLKSVILIMRGNGTCDESRWLVKYLNDKVKIVYYVQGFFRAVSNLRLPTYPWPLGVDTSRSFPKIRIKPDDLRESRKFRCVFIARDYYDQHVIREIDRIVKRHRLQQYCYIKRHSSFMSTSEYLSILLDADLIISPPSVLTGLVETYQLYEALSVGTTPIILRHLVGKMGDVGDVTHGYNKSHGQCDLSVNNLSSLHLFNAPVIYVDSWEDISVVVKKDMDINDLEREKRRITCITWYNKLKLVLKQQVLDSFT